MEIKININGDTWVVPNSIIPRLILWLNANAISTTRARTEQARININNDKELILE